MPRFEELKFDSSTGKNKIRAIRCIPDGEIRGVVQVVHGLEEHIDRYRDFMTFLAEHGFLCVGDDHLGHGRTVTRPEERGVFSPKDGWGRVMRDVIRLRRMTATQYPNVPYVFFGHSMGSFIVRNITIDHPEAYDLAIISATGNPNRLQLFGGWLVGKVICAIRGYSSSGELMAKVSMGGNMKGIENPRTPNDWLSRDEEAVDRYMADPLCGITAKAGLYTDMLSGVRMATSRLRMRKVDREKPVMLISGDADPVGQWGVGVEKVHKAYQHRVRDLTYKLYPGARHELLNELNRDEVYADILNWIEKRI